MEALLKKSHAERFLEAGWLLLLQFKEGWVPLRVTGTEWANLEPWPLGAVPALGLSGGPPPTYDTVQDANNRHYLEPYVEDLIYHTYWGVTPARARIFVQYPVRIGLGSMLDAVRTEGGNVGYIDGVKSPFGGPFAEETEVITVKERYPAFQAANPLNDPMYNAMMNFDQRHYTYQIVNDAALVKDMLVGNRRVKKFTMGLAETPQTIPQWLQNDVNALPVSLAGMAGKPPKTLPLLDYTTAVMGGKA